MIDFIFQDNNTKRYTTFTGDDDRKKLIQRNTKELKKVYPHVNLYYYDSLSDVPEELGKGWSQDQDTYEEFVRNYNNLNTTKVLMSAWNPNR